MYTIEKKKYGFRFVFSGFITAQEMTNWLEEVRKHLATPVSKEFGVFVDMQEMMPLPDEVQKIIVDGQALCKSNGMVRSVVILKSSVLSMQFRRLAKESGIYQWERYLSSSGNPDYEKAGEAWITSGLDPDLP